MSTHGTLIFFSFFSSILLLCIFVCVPFVSKLPYSSREERQLEFTRVSPRGHFILESSAVLPRKLLWGQLIFKLRAVEVRDAPAHAGKWRSDWMGLLETNMVSRVRTQISGIPPMAALILQ